MAKQCSNGHQMEDSWDICPHCQRTGYQNAGSTAKTRLEVESIIAPRAGASSASPAPALNLGSPAALRKTVLLGERPPKRDLVGWLVAMDGDQKGDDFRLRDGQNIIGSAPDADIPLRDETVSGKHASLRYKDAKFFLTDLDSTNGTFLNDGDQAVARQELNDNDMIRVGGVTLKFKAL
jgi:Inner membrane component of T3SS, cytoplasmic domain